MQKNNIKKENIVVNYAAAAILVGFAGLVLVNTIASSIGRSGKYVVTDKGANKIEYYSIKNPADTHVMTFDTDTVSFYPYINIGDTITGDARFMNEPISKEYIDRAYFQDVKGHLPKKIVKEPVISAVNGHNFPELQKIAIRDSMMRQKQK